jgi:hypothetical protein
VSFNSFERKYERASFAIVPQTDTNSKELVSYLQSKSSFLRDTWEKKAAHYNARQDMQRSQLKDVLDIKHLCAILDEHEEKGQCLRFGVDCCAMAYVDGERSDLGGSMGEVLDSKEAQKLYSMGATLQARNLTAADARLLCVTF